MAAALAAAAQAVSAVGSTAITQAFQNKVYKAQAQQIITQTQLNVLTQAQQADLAKQLQDANSDTARMQILTNAVTQIEIANAQSAANNNIKVAVIFVSVGFALLIAAIFIKKSLSK